MSNEFYFSQYESPNIVIIPTMSCNPSSPKRQKIGNNIVVPIVSNSDCEKQKIKLMQGSKNNDKSNPCKEVHSNETIESSSKSRTSLKGSWAEKYLQSIGLDKKSSIWNRKIPRKTDSLKSVVSVQQSNNSSTEVPHTSTTRTQIDNKNGNQLKNSYKPETDLNVLKDSNIKIKHDSETQNRFVKGKCKGSKQSNRELTKSVLMTNSHGTVTGHNNKTLKIVTCKNESIENKQHKIKTDNSKKNKSLDVSSTQKLRRKPEKIIHATSRKDIKSKFKSEYGSLNFRPKCHSVNNEKSKTKPVVRTQNDVKDNSKNRIKTVLPTKNDSIELSSTYSYNNYSDNCVNTKCSTKGKLNKKDRVPKKTEIPDLNKSVLKTARHNTDLKTTKVARSKIEASNSTKTKEKRSQSKSKSESNNKTIKSPIKRKSSKTKKDRKIKIVINLIYNKKPAQTLRSEINDNNSVCTGSNVDLDFLNDFDIDEIVESLDTCNIPKPHIQNLTKFQNEEDVEKENVKHTIQNDYKNNSDAIDLIKTLKGEEDDDLMRISIENGKDLLISNIVNNENILNESNDNNTVTKDNSVVLIKTEEYGTIEKFGKDFEQSSDLVSNLNNVMIHEDIDTDMTVETCNININKIEKVIKETTLKRQVDESKHDGGQSTDNVESRTSESLLIEFTNNNKNSNIQTKDEQNMKTFIEVRGSSPGLYEVNTDSNKELKLHSDKTQTINEESCNYVTLNENKLKNRNNKEKHHQSVDSLYSISQDKCVDEHNDAFPKNTNTNNITKIGDEKNTTYECSSNLSKTDSDVKDTDLANKNKQNDHIVENLHQQKPETLDNKCLFSEQENKSANVINKYMTASNKDKINDKGNNNVTINSICHTNVPQQNNVYAHNDHDPNCFALMCDKVKDESISLDAKMQKDKHENGKVEHKIQENLKKNNQEDFKAIKKETVKSRSEKQLSNNNEKINIKIKDDQETLLEQRLLTCTGSKYTIISLIRNGKYSKIYKCGNGNGKQFALKMLTTNKVYNLGKERTYMLNSLTSDIPKDNLFIIRLVNSFVMGNTWCFLMEYYPKNLDEILSEAAKPFSLQHIQDYARQLVMAVMVIRNKNMVHLDIKPKHILINSSNNMLKLCGFDRLCYARHMKVLPNCGTVNYRAPEVILGYKCGFKIDVWSTGLVLYEMAANKKLFPGIFNNDMLYKHMCTLGDVPYNMIRNSRFASEHFVGSKFMRKLGFKGQNISIISNFIRNSKLRDSIYEAYYKNWGRNRTITQHNSDMGKLSLFIKLLQKMLAICPESRLPIEFVYSNPFIFDAYTCQE